MPTPDFIVELRRQVGHTPLWLSGANAIVLRDDEVLLIRRSDTGDWAPISGIVEPGESPDVTVVREAAEEAGVEIEVERMVWLDVTEVVEYANGDVTQYLDHGFRCRYVGGEPGPVDGEATEVAWFRVDTLPSPRHPKLDAMVAVAVANARDVVLGLAGWSA